MNTSNEKNNESKKTLAWEEYYCTRTYERRVISSDTIAGWCKDLMQWTDSHPEAEYLSQYLKERGIDRNDFDDLVRKYPDLKKAKAYLMHAIGERDRSLAKAGNANWQVVKHSLWRHAPEFKEDDDHHAALKAKTEDGELKGNVRLILNYEGEKK